MLEGQNKKLLEIFEEEKTKLEQELKEFTIESNRPGDYNARFPSHEQDLESNALAVQEMENRKALERELEERLRIVNENIKKIDKGTYGVCENCSTKIDEKRLKVIPTAYLCIACASKTGR